MCISACMDQLNGTGAYRSLQEPTSVKSRLRRRCHCPRLLLRRGLLLLLRCRLRCRLRARLGCTQLGSAARAARLAIVWLAFVRGLWWHAACGPPQPAFARGLPSQINLVMTTSAGMLSTRTLGLAARRTLDRHSNAYAQSEKKARELA